MTTVSELTRELAIFDVLPSLRLPAVRLGEFPTPLQHAPSLGEHAFIKRDDLSSPIYGGNKVRVLEVLFAEALEAGHHTIEATGARGTNHGVATALHAPRVGLTPHALIFPQPPSETARANETLLERRARVHRIAHWSLLPTALATRRFRRTLRGERVFVMAPGGATPRGALAYVSAAFELAHQLRDDDIALDSVVVGVGSTCTSAGLLLGLRLAHDFGLLDILPTLVAVRVTPWPVTSHWRVAHLAHAASIELARRCGDPSLERSRTQLASALELDGSKLGGGYGVTSTQGRAAMARFDGAGLFSLDTTYSAKAAATFLERVSRERTLYWSTKSTAPLPSR